MKARAPFIIVSVVAVGALCFLAVWYTKHPRTTQKQTNQLITDNTMGTLQVTSSAFAQNEMIPREYTCQGSNINPPLTVKGVPSGAKSLVLVMDDPDAPIGVWDHWIVWNIATDTNEIAANSVPPGAVQGRNSGGNNRYDGPCPPTGTHHYRFTLYALSDVLSLAPQSDKRTVLKAIESKILDQFTLIGLYAKT